MSLAGYVVAAIDRSAAQELVIAKHYLHRRASCSFAWALRNPSGEILGVVMYGSPVSSTLCRGICGPEEASNVIELTRLWVDDSVPKNGESYLIGRTLRLVPKDIVVSFADPSAAHRGVVYQATNFLYTGLGPQRKKWVNLERPDLHFHRGSTQGRSYEELRQEAHLAYIPAVRKHRYIWFAPRRRRELLAKLRYPILAYPK